MAMPHYDVIVLGLGGMGSAALYHVARQGRRVLGIEQFGPAHDRGSSHGETRIIRQAYFEHADYVPLLLNAYELWHALEQASGESLLSQVGLLQVGPPDGVVVPGVLSAARLHGLAVESLSAAMARERFPGLKIAADSEAVFEPKAGFLRVERCILTHLAAAKAAGAEALHHVTVQDWESRPDSIRVRTSAGDFTADRLVITAGPWTSAVLGEKQLALRVLRKHIYWYGGGSREYDVARGFPTFLFERPEGIFYGFPQIDELGVKVGEHTGGQLATDLLNDPRTLDTDDERRVSDFLTSCLPGVGRRLARHSVCYYTMSADEHFVVDRHPTAERVVFAAGFSGHGFKFASVLGQALAELACEGNSRLPIGFLGLRRFLERDQRLPSNGETP